MPGILNLSPDGALLVIDWLVNRSVRKSILKGLLNSPVSGKFLISCYGTVASGSGMPQQETQTFRTSRPSFGLAAVLLHEFLDTAGRIDELLLPGEEWMAIRANFNFEKLSRFGRTCLKCIATNTSYCHIVVLGMNSASHFVSYLRLNL